MKPLPIPLRGAALALLMLTACTPNVPRVAAQEPGPDTACVLDGMVLRDFPGPKAQIQYAEGKPDFFCDMMELFSVLLAPEQKRGVAGLYVQDMGQAEWAHPAGHWIAAQAAYYVLGGDQPGSMGPTLGSFGTEQTAQAYVRRHGGQVLRFAQISGSMVKPGGAARGMAMMR